MSDGVDPEIIKKTQQVLGKHIKKPPLTEKLLNKPPFRFLHDVIVAVIKNTGFLKGLFTSDELNPENVKDRDAKIAFLNKLIDAVKNITNIDLKVRATKIVAGLQVNETNLLLQAIANGIENNLVSSELLIKQNKSAAKNEQTKNKKSSGKDSNGDKKSPTVEKNRENRSRSKARETPKDKKVPSKDSSSRGKKTEDTKSSSRSRKGDTSTRRSELNKKIESPPKRPDVIEENNKEISSSQLIKDSGNINKNDIISDNSRPKTRDVENGYLAKINTEKSEEPIEIPVEKNIEPPNEPEILIVEAEKKVEASTVRHPSARPKSARPRSGEFREKSEKSNASETENKNLKQETNENIVLQLSNQQRPKSSLRPPSVRPSSARPGAPRLRPDSALPIQEVIPMGKINVIVENFDNDADDEGTVIIHNAPEETLSVESTVDLSVKNQSHLVEQILDQIKDTEDMPKKEIDHDWEQDNIRGRDTTSKEMNQLRNLIQSFTKTANPLGKLLNYLHEDFETMHAELQQWTKIKIQLFDEIEKQQKLKSEIEKPLVEKLKNLNRDIAKQEQEIMNVRSNIIKNDARIKELILK